MLKIYCFMDIKAKFYESPVFIRSRGDAIREFQRLANDKNTRVGMYPEDFVLYEIGSWSDQTGEITSQVPVSLGKGVDYVKEPAPAVEAPVNLVDQLRKEATANL